MIEIIDPYVDPEDKEEGSSTDVSLIPECKGVVVKTSTRQTVFLPIPGLVRAEDVIPGELVGVNKDSYIVLEKLPTEFDSRVKAMEVDEKPTEDYTEIGGLDKQIQVHIPSIPLYTSIPSYTLYIPLYTLYIPSIPLSIFSISL